MVLRRSLVVLLVISVVFPNTALGQVAMASSDQGPEQQLSIAQVDELKKWVKDDLKYQKWYKASGNKIRVKLRHRPAPPVWLSAECIDLIGGEGLLVTACDRFREIGEGDALTRTRKAVQAQRAHKEALIKSKWYERIHLGGAWPIVSDFKQSKYGAIIETHISIVDIGRLEINLPGIMFVSVPDNRGRRVIKQATHFGMSLKLTTFTLPGTKQQFVSHLNFTNARIMDGFSNFADREGLSLMGLSLTVKK